MKIKELAEVLAQLPQGMEVKMSIDPEGNRFRSLDDYSIEGWNKFRDEPSEKRCANQQHVLILWPR